MIQCFVLLSFLLLTLVNARHSHDVTTLAPRAQDDNQCCFVIQDHLSVNYWARKARRSLLRWSFAEHR